MSGNPWHRPPTDEAVIAEALRRVEAGEQVAAVARACGIHRDTIYKHLKRRGTPKSGEAPLGEGLAPIVAEMLSEKPPQIPDAPAAVSPPPETPEERHRRRQELEAERKLLKEVTGERSLRAFLEELLREIVEPAAPIPPPEPPAWVDGTSSETMLLLLSDWHSYEIVKSERVLGLNEYDATVFGRRVKQVIDTTLGIKAKMERGGGWTFPKLVVACNGDFVSGTIHELERHTDAPNIVRAVQGCWRVLGQAIGELAAAFPAVDVVCTSGNHGRLPDARRMQQKDPTRNWDTLVYLGAQEMLRSSGHIRWIIPDSYTAPFTIGPWKFLAYHGHDVKSWNSVPYYGLDRFGRNVNALLSVDGRAPNYFLISHFHSASTIPSAGGETIINGSLIGGNEFSVNALGKCDRPVQYLLCVHPEHGVTSRWPILAAGESAASYDVRPWEGAA